MCSPCLMDSSSRVNSMGLTLTSFSHSPLNPGTPLHPVKTSIYTFYTLRNLHRTLDPQYKGSMKFKQERRREL